MPTRDTLAVFVTLLLMMGACGGPEEASGSDCVPTIDASVPVSGDPNRRIEDIIEALTGWSTADIVEGMTLEDEIDDPNFAGVYGDPKGGIIVTVVDCSSIDIDEIAEIAGGAEAVRIVEVPHNWREISGFRDTLVAELRAAGLRGDVNIDSTNEGRKIEVRTPDVDALPDGFGSTVPSTAFIIAETDDISGEQ
ncbi:MAG: hypothetical protein GY720_21090 [bacterium]|nr:hypothetical protein [bacterium]